MPHASIANTTSIVEIMQYANNVSSGIYGVGAMIALYIIIVLVLKSKGEDTPETLMVAGLVTSITSVLFLVIQLLNSKHLFIVFLMCVLPIIWAYTRKSA